MLRSNVFWSFLDAGLNGVVAILAQLLIARIIGPEQLGIAVAATATFQIIQTGLAAVFHDSIVQRPEVTPRTVTAAALVGCGLGVLAAVLMQVSGHFAAIALAEPLIETLSWPLAVSLPLLGAASPSIGLLTRRRAFRTIAIRSVVGQLSGLVLGLGLAFGGHGALASVVQTLAIVLVNSILSVIATRSAFGRGFEWKPLGPILSLGAANGSNALLFIARYRLFALLAGASGGASFLGHLHMAFRLVDALRDLAMGALHRLLLPTYSELQGDLPRIQEAFRSSLEMIALLAVPFFLALAVGLGPIVRIALGPGWSDSVAPGVILAIFAAWSMVRYPAGAVKMASGRSFTLLGTTLLLTALTIGLMLLFPPSDVLFAAVLWVVPTLLLVPLTFWQTRWTLKLGVIEQLRPAIRGTFVAAGAALGAMGPSLYGVEPADNLTALAVRLGLFTVAWLLLALLLARPALLRVKSIVLRR